MFSQKMQLLPMPILGAGSSREYRVRRIHFLSHLWLKATALLVIVSIIGIALRQNHFHNPFSPKRHKITLEDIALETSLSTPGVGRMSLTRSGFLPDEEINTYCAAHNWKPYPHRERRRKVYDLVMINSELDWLEIRLNEHHKNVDYFVVLESATTFTGNPKPLSLQENWDRFAKFHHQIIYHILTDPPPPEANSWAHERHQRNAMFDQVFPHLNATQGAHYGDVILVSDLDEIIRPATLTLLRNCEFPARLTLRSEFYYYSYQWRHWGPEWAHPEATFYKSGNTILPADLRGPSHKKQDLWNAGWHCSSCFSTLAELLLKMESFSHTELNEARFREEGRIVKLVREGKDLWGRFGQWYRRVENNQDIPNWLRSPENRERFGYMLDRDGENAGFTDYHPSKGL